MAGRTLRAHRYRPVRWLYAAGFLAYLHLTFVAFFNSSFVAGFLGERGVGVLYIVGSLIAIAGFFSISHILSRIGNYRVLVITTTIEALALLGLATINDPFVLVPLFVIHLATYPLIFFTLDVFLENYTHPEGAEEDRTGRVRGLYLAIANFAFMAAPLFIGYVLGDAENFHVIYAMAAGILLPFLAITALKFRRFIDPKYHSIDVRHVGSTLALIFRNPNLSGVFGAHFLLRLFYAWSIVYLPIYLHTHIGFSWPTIGIILAVTLSPYVLFEIPIGRWADRYLGEQEFMVVGFFILGLAVASVPFLGVASLPLWIVLIFLMESGASFVEITTESYFFKQVASNNVNLISLFRMIQPIAYSAGIAFASMMLFALDLGYLFTVFGVILLFGMIFAMQIEDTR